MSLENLNRLEKRLTQVVDTLVKLNSKNKLTKSSQAEVLGKMSDYQKERQALSHELEKIKNDKNKLENRVKTQKNELKRRIESLLTKLEGLKG